MLQLLGLIKHTRLHYHVFSKSVSNGSFRYLSDSSKNPTDGSKCKNKEEKKNEPAKAEKKKPDCEKKNKPEKVEPKRDETEVRGGSKCKNKEKPACPPSSSDNPNKPSCIELILQREGIKKKQKAPKLTDISGGGPRCPCRPIPRPTPSYKHSKRWQKISMMGVLPLVAILTVLVLTAHHEEDRPEFKRYTYMYQRTKPFFWGDGNHALFHNSYWNALPPDGYEDEIDLAAIGKSPESDKEREARLKEFADKQKEYKKFVDKRTAEAKKAAAAAEKEAKKQQAEAEKAEKKEKAAAEKERKRLEAEEKKELQRQEAEEKKRAKEEAKKVDHAILTSDDES